MILDGPRLKPSPCHDNHFISLASMSDSSKKPAAIPSWQQSQQSKSEDASAEPPKPATEVSHVELLKQAREFLREESIRDAPRDKKEAFLENKGLSKAEVAQLLEEDLTAVSIEQTEELKTVHDSNKMEAVDTEKQPSTTLNTPSQSEGQPASAQPLQRPPQQQSQPRPERDIPPIITYPEFLLKPQKPPPLVTVSHLISGAYVFSALTALLYGANNYMVEPMVETLTEARQSLASTTIENLKRLNQKLESSVSHVPYIPSLAARNKALKDDNDSDEGRDDDDDNDSITSDPTELFHRDVATQTTPNLSRTPSNFGEDTDVDLTNKQITQMGSLTRTLKAILHEVQPRGLSAIPGKKCITTAADLVTTLERLELVYYNGPPTTAPLPTKNFDAAAKVRIEIRALKGYFLSARNFPSAPRPTGLTTKIRPK